MACWDDVKQKNHCSTLTSEAGIHSGLSFPLILGMDCLLTSLARYFFCFRRLTRLSKLINQNGELAIVIFNFPVPRLLMPRIYRHRKTQKTALFFKYHFFSDHHFQKSNDFIFGKGWESISKTKGQSLLRWFFSIGDTPQLVARTSLMASI